MTNQQKVNLLKDELIDKIESNWHLSNFHVKSWVVNDVLMDLRGYKSRCTFASLIHNNNSKICLLICHFFFPKPNLKHLKMIALNFVINMRVCALVTKPSMAMYLTQFFVPIVGAPPKSANGWN